MNKEGITFDTPNNAIPREIKDICRKCEDNIHCQNKGCAFRSLGNEYCDVVLNATKLYLKLQKENKQLKEEIKTLKMIVHGLVAENRFPTEIYKLIAKINDEISWDEYLDFLYETKSKKKVKKNKKRGGIDDWI